MPATPNRAVRDYDDRVLVIERTFDAPRALVWKAFTQTKHIAQWMGAARLPVEVP